MSCCGRSSTGFSAPPAARGAAAAARTPAAPVLFEQCEDGPLTMFGTVTGARYHFTGLGARVRVDARDAPVIAVVRGLAAVGA